METINLGSLEELSSRNFVLVIGELLKVLEEQIFLLIPHFCILGRFTCPCCIAEIRHYGFSMNQLLTIHFTVESCTAWYFASYMKVNRNILSLSDITAVLVCVSTLCDVHPMTGSPNSTFHITYISLLSMAYDCDYWPSQVTL